MGIDLRGFSGDWIKAENLIPEGDLVTIQSVSVERGRFGDQLILTLRNGAKIGCGKIMVADLMAIFGPDSDAMLGRTIHIYPDHVQTSGGLKQVIRCQAAQGGAAPPQAPTPAPPAPPQNPPAQSSAPPPQGAPGDQGNQGGYYNQSAPEGPRSPSAPPPAPPAAPQGAPADDIPF